MFEKIYKLINERGETFSEFIETFMGGNADVFLQRLTPNNEEIPFHVLMDIYENYPLSVLRFQYNQDKNRLKDLIFKIFMKGDDTIQKNGNYYVRLENYLKLSDFFHFRSPWYGIIQYLKININCDKEVESLLSYENKMLIKQNSYELPPLICMFIQTEMYKIFKDDLYESLYNEISNALEFPNGKGVKKVGDNIILNLTKVINTFTNELENILNDPSFNNNMSFVWDNTLSHFFAYHKEINPSTDVLKNPEKREVLSEIVNNKVSSYLSNKNK